jgi:hypothetical protein
MPVEELKRQVRRVILPTQKLFSFLCRRAPAEFVRAKLLELHSDVRTNQLILHIETQTDVVMDEAGHPVPLDHTLDWDEVFGIIPCEVSGEPTPVEDITVSRKAGLQQKDDLLRLSHFLTQKFPATPEEGTVDWAIRLLSERSV